MNSLKDLYLLLEEENLTSPSHQSDKRVASDEQPLSPTIKVGDNQGVRHHNPPSHVCLCMLCPEYCCFTSAPPSQVAIINVMVIKLNVNLFLKQLNLLVLNAVSLLGSRGRAGPHASLKGQGHPWMSRQLIAEPFRGYVTSSKVP